MFWRQSLFRLDFDGEKITSASLESGEHVGADVYVLATNPFAAAEILGRTPELEQQDQLRFFRPLIQGGPHTQVSLRLAFAERILWPRKRTALVIADSEFDLTLFAQEQVWDSEWTSATVSDRCRPSPLASGRFLAGCMAFRL